MTNRFTPSSTSRVWSNQTNNCTCGDFDNADYCPFVLAARKRNWTLLANLIADQIDNYCGLPPSTLLCECGATGILIRELERSEMWQKEQHGADFYDLLVIYSKNAVLYQRNSNEIALRFFYACLEKRYLSSSFISLREIVRSNMLHRIGFPHNLSILEAVSVSQIELYYEYLCCAAFDSLVSISTDLYQHTFPPKKDVYKVALPFFLSQIPFSNRIDVLCYAAMGVFPQCVFHSVVMDACILLFQIGIIVTEPILESFVESMIALANFNISGVFFTLPSRIAYVKHCLGAKPFESYFALVPRVRDSAQRCLCRRALVHTE